MPKNQHTFGFRPGRKVGRRYVIEASLGRGSEGEVYQIRELDTGIRRAAKFYFPHLDPDHKRSIQHARKLNALRHCPIVLQYHHSEIIIVNKRPAAALISELCDGQPLYRWVNTQPGRRLAPYLALHVLYHLARGLEAIHALGEYHADVHTENILIKPRGVLFELKLIDFYDWGKPARYKQQQDIVDTIRVFYDCLGGRAHYAKLPDPIKQIIIGLKRKLILKRFPAIAALRRHLETFDWHRLT